MHYQLKRPITFDGNPVTGLAFDFEKLTGADLLQVEQMLRKRLAVSGEMLLMPESDSRYLVALAALAAGVPVELIHALKAGDYMQVVSQARVFLMGEGEEEIPPACDQDTTPVA
jgi:hypothetical protein